MSYDLFFGNVKRNWSRPSANLAPMTDDVDAKFTPEEKVMLERIAMAKMAADLGDKKAKKQLVKTAKTVAKLKAKAAKGDAKAAHTLTVLQASGIFANPQTLTMTGYNGHLAFIKGWGGDDVHAKERRMSRFAEEISKYTSSDQIDEAAMRVAFNPEYQGFVKTLATQNSWGPTVNANAQKILTASKRVLAMQAAKEKQLDEDRKKFLPAPRVATAGDFVGRETRAQRKARRARHIQNLKTRASQGDRAAIAKLQAMQQQLSSTVLPTTSPPTSYPQSYSALTPTPTVPGTTPSYPQSYSSPYYPQYANQYAASYPSSYYDPYGNYVAPQQPTSGPYPQPTIDVFVGEEERALAAEGGACERAALRRRTQSPGISGAFVGNAIPNDVYRATVVKYAMKSAGGGKPTTKDFFVAKAAVDKVIGKAGITLYMPGAKPGRRTV